MTDTTTQTPSSPETEIHIEELASGPMEIQKRDERHLSSSVVSLAVQDDQWSFTPPVSPRTGESLLKPGKYRYLRGRMDTFSPLHHA